VATSVAPASSPGLPWPWIALGGVLVLAGGCWALMRRSRAETLEPETIEPEPIAVPEPVAPIVPVVRAPAPAAAVAPIAPAAPAGDRPWLELGFRPKRAGTNLLSAAVDYELTLTNRGSGAARDIRVACDLLGANQAQDAEIVALYDQPIDAPAAPPFTLAPGEVRVIHGFAGRARDRIEPIEVRGRPMFVPIVVARARYGYDAQSAGLATASYVVGIERAGEARMAPIWLDQPPRMHREVGARPYTAGATGVRRIGTPEQV
jgi:hypothetical protein